MPEGAEKFQTFSHNLFQVTNKNPLVKFSTITGNACIQLLFNGPHISIATPS